MEDKVFQECLNWWKKENGGRPYWGRLAERFGYADGESLRLKFKREREKRGINKTSASGGGAKILIFDIESLPLQVFSWGVYDQRISPEAVIRDWFMVSWAAKWLFQPTVLSGVLTPEEVRDGNDLRISKSIWNLLNEADIVIAHNGDRFDIPRLNTRFLKHKLGPTSNYKSIDTLKVARSKFDLTSNKLDFMNGFLGLRHKEETGGFDLWKKCYFGDKKALTKMESYNRHDVEILEDLYVILRPWISGHPNLALYSEVSDEMCPNCGSLNLEVCGNYVTGSGKYESLRCECGAISRRKTNILSKEKRKKILA